MPDQIISASGTQFGLIINSDGSLNANITGSIVIGSVSAEVDAIYGLRMRLELFQQDTRFDRS